MAGSGPVKKTSQARHKLEPLLEPLLQSTRGSPAPMALFDARRAFVVASPSWEQVANIRGDDCVGLPIETMLPDIPASVIELHERCATGEQLLGDEEAYVGAEQLFARGAALVQLDHRGGDVREHRLDGKADAIVAPDVGDLLPARAGDHEGAAGVEQRHGRRRAARGLQQRLQQRFQLVFGL